LVPVSWPAEKQAFVSMPCSIGQQRNDLSATSQKHDAELALLNRP
jgi:hypothetical protein